MHLSYQNGWTNQQEKGVKLVNKVIVSGITAGLSAVAIMKAMKNENQT